MKVRELFDKCATAYDQERPKVVPHFDEFYDCALSMIPFQPDESVSILDLGAGTGLLAAMVGQAFPAAKLHLTDISEKMLAVAKQRFADNSLVTFAVQEHLQLSAVSEYDLILSALSIHHLDHPDKQELFRRIFKALRPGGMFINADQALGPTPQEEDEYDKQWLADVRANGVSKEVLEQTRERMREDKNALLGDQLRWLSESGFSNVGCRYQRSRFVVYGGTRLTGN